LDDFKKGLGEVKRVLKKDGILVILEPNKKGNSWASPRLVKGSKEFDKELHKKKMEGIERGEEAINKQIMFKIKEKESSENFYLLILKSA